MANLNYRSLIDLLSTSARLAFDDAMSLCVSLGHREVAIEHFLVALLDQPDNDFRIALKVFDVNLQEARARIKAAYPQPRSQSGRLPVFAPLLLDLLKDAWLVSSVELGHRSIRSGAILIAFKEDIARFARFDYLRLFDKVSGAQLKARFGELVDGSIETIRERPPQPPIGGSDGGGADARKDGAGGGAESALGKFAICFTHEARQGRIDPIFCRDDEIRQIIDILSRRRKNNPICVGEAGVGKTALAEGLALRIANGTVPQNMRDIELWGLDIGALQAGASMRGEFEKRLKGVLDDVKASDKPVVLFIDEAHTLIGAGAQAGGSDAANLLKPALARGEIKAIAATTWSEYKKYFEKDPALSRRFQLVKLDEPTIEQAKIILRGLKSAFENAHDVYINESAIDSAARLSERYITGRQLPDKAIDVLDTACARARASLVNTPQLLNRLETEQLALRHEYESIRRDQDVSVHSDGHQERLHEISQRLDVVAGEIAPLRAVYDELKRLADAYLASRQAVLGDQEAQADEEGADHVPGDEMPRVGAPNAGDSKHDIDVSAPPDAPPDQPDQPDPAEQSLERTSPLAPVRRGEGDTVEIGTLRRRFEALRQKSPLVSVDVGEMEISQVISDWTGIPLNTLAADEISRVVDLARNLGKKIKGQDHALGAIEERLQASRLGFQKAGQPLGVFLLIGPSGVGKTETGMEIARQLFGSEQFVTTINMTEYQERHTVSRLIGSPPGYVGYGEGGILTEALRKKPYSVVLLDEVEKADANVLNLFYQVFDKGTLADGEGRLVDCKNAVFVLTTNLGAEQIVNWYAQGENDTRPGPMRMLRSLEPVLAQHFKPALLARMASLVYLPLNDEVMAQIVAAKIDELAATLWQAQRIALSVSEAARTHIQTMCSQGSSGARLIDQVLAKQFLPTISLEVLERGAEDIRVKSAAVDFEPEKGVSIAFSHESSGDGNEVAA